MVIRRDKTSKEREREWKRNRKRKGNKGKKRRKRWRDGEEKKKTGRYRVRRGWKEKGEICVTWTSIEPSYKETITLFTVTHLIQIIYGFTHSFQCDGRTLNAYYFYFVLFLVNISIYSLFNCIAHICIHELQQWLFI